MDWKKALKLFLILPVLFFATGCVTNVSGIEICKVFVNEQIGECAEKKKKFKKRFPSDMIGYNVFDELALELLGERLQECETLGRLPRNDRTWEEMDVCILDKEMCGNRSFRFIDEGYAVPAKDARRIIRKLEFCRKL